MVREVSKAVLGVLLLFHVLNCIGSAIVFVEINVVGSNPHSA